MRKTSAALATLSLALAALTGCAAAPAFDGGAACDRAAAAGDVADLATVSGEVGEKPQVELHTPIGAGATTFADLVVGDGAPLTSLTQGAVIEFMLFSGKTGTQIGATASDAEQSQLASIDYWASRVPAFGTFLECATGGSRILGIISPEDFGAQNLTSFGLEQDEPVVALFDVVETFPARADGSLQFNDARGMPTVVRAPDGRPGVIVSDAAAPTDLEVQTLIQGDGPVVQDDDTVLVQYTGVLWDEKTVFDSSWDRGPAQFSLTGTIPGFSKGLAGKTVGSQVLIVAPPEFGYGENGQGSVPENATLVFVVDILAVDPPAQAQ